MKLNHALKTTEFRSSYDHNAKLLISKKECLARILQGCVTDFKNMEVKEIIPHIESVEIDRVPLEPGLTNCGPLNSLDKENYEPGEGTVFFDLLFNVTLPDSERARIQINIEIHNRTSPWRILIPRSIYYPARMLSSQGDRDFSLAKQEYDHLHKVISIWISLDVPEYMADTIVSYSIKPEFLYGGPYKIQGNYDLMETIHVNIGKDPEKSNELIRFLYTLLSNTYKAEEKEKILTSEYEMEFNEDDRRRIRDMEGILDGFIKTSTEEGFRKGFDNGLKKGIKQGIKQGTSRMHEKNIAAAALAVESGKLCLSDAVELFEVTEEEISTHQKTNE